MKIMRNPRNMNYYCDGESKKCNNEENDSIDIDDSEKEYVNGEDAHLKRIRK